MAGAIRFALLTAWVAILGNGGFCEGSMVGDLFYGGYVRYKREVPPYKKLFPGGESHEVMYKDQKIELNRNSDGVAIVRADDEIGAIYGQGFMQAIDRPWQIFNIRRAAQGRLSELKEVDVFVQLDRHSRAMGYCQRERGRDEVIDAFAQGVTDGMHWLAAEGFKPTEAHFLIEPDKMWTAADVMCIVRFILMSMSHGLFEEYTNAMMEVSLDPAKVDVQNLLKKLSLPLNDVEVEDHPTSEELEAAESEKVNGKEWFNFRPAAFLQGDHGARIGISPPVRSSRSQVDKKRSLLPYGRPNRPHSDAQIESEAGLPQVGIQGSQSVTVGSGLTRAEENSRNSESRRRQPLLLSDPHLKVTQPSFWHHIMMVTKKGTIVGGGAAGMPGIFMGHNDNMAWGPTLSFIDKEDLFRVKIVRCELDLLINEALEYGVEDKALFEGKQCYVYDKKHVPILFKEEKIMGVDGGLAKKILVRHTHFGPIISDHFEKFWVVADNLTKKRIPKKEREQSHIALAHASVSRRSPFDSSYITKMFTVKSKDEFKQLLEAPGSAGMSVTIAYITKADEERKDGEHGILISGGFPIRHKPEDNMIRNGEDSASDWKGVLPFDQLPHRLGSSGDYLVTANQRLSDKSLGNSYNTNWRYNRLRFLLSKQHVAEQKQLDEGPARKLLRIDLDQFSKQASYFKRLLAKKLFTCSDMSSLLEPVPIDPVSISQERYNEVIFEVSQPAFPERGHPCWLREEVRSSIPAIKDALWVLSKFVSWDCVIGYNSGIAAVYEYWLMSAAQVWLEELGSDEDSINIFFGESIDYLIFPNPSRIYHWPGIFLREMKSDASAGVILARGLTRALLKMAQVHSWPSVRKIIEGGKLTWGKAQQMVAVSSMHPSPVQNSFDTPPADWVGGDSSTVLPAFHRAAYYPYDEDDYPRNEDRPNFGDEFLSSSTRMIANPENDWKDSWWSLQPGTNGWLGDPFCKSYIQHMKQAIPMPFVTYDQFDAYVRDHAFRNSSLSRSRKSTRVLSGSHKIFQKAHGGLPRNSEKKKKKQKKTKAVRRKNRRRGEDKF